MDSPVREGVILGGTYRLENLLGEGGMGSVYAASHTRVPRRFAVKLLNPEVLGNKNIFERFQREAEIASSLGSQHITQVFDFNHAPDGTPYMVLELLEGEDLSRRLRRGPLSLAETTSILDQICQALTVAHAHGIVHRDLKPSNLFICRHEDRTDFVKIMDFGISKVMHNSVESTRTGIVLGTPNYMAPEQAEGRQSEIDLRTDLFALGAILYECLTGRQAFQAPTPIGTMYQVCHSDPEPIRQLAPHVPPAVEQVIARVMAKRRELRYASAADLAADFHRACSGMELAGPGSAAVATTALRMSTPIPIVASPTTPMPMHMDAMRHSTPMPMAAPPTTPMPMLAPSTTPMPMLAPSTTPMPMFAPSTTPMPMLATPTTLGGAASQVMTPAPMTAPAPGRGKRVAVAAGLVALVAIGTGVALGIRGGKSADGAGAGTPGAPEPAVAAAPAPAPEPPAPAPAAPAPVQPAPAPAPEPQLVELRFRVTPAGARVSIDGLVVSAPSVKLPRGERSYKLEVTASGYEPQTRDIRPVIDGEIVVDLEKKRRAKSKTDGPKIRPDGPVEGWE